MSCSFGTENTVKARKLQNVLHLFCSGLEKTQTEMGENITENEARSPR